MDHQKQLQRYCRVCAKLMSTKEYKYSVNKNENILKCSGIDISGDNPHIHPTYLCGSCCTKAKRYHDAKQVNSSLKEHPWKEHMASDCYVCSQPCMGRPTKSKDKSGRPCDGSNQSIANRILHEAPPSMKAAGPFLPLVSYHRPQCPSVICSVVSAAALSTNLCKHLVGRQYVVYASVWQYQSVSLLSLTHAPLAQGSTPFQMLSSSEDGKWEFGVLGEQGAESIHTIFNQLERTYSNITNKVDRLKEYGD